MQMNTEKLIAFVTDSRAMAASELRRAEILAEDKQAELRQIQGRIQQLHRVIADCDEALAEGTPAPMTRKRKAE
jgi:hypothetical protein